MIFKTGVSLGLFSRFLALLPDLLGRFKSGRPHLMVRTLRRFSYPKDLAILRIRATDFSCFHDKVLQCFILLRG